MFTFKRKEELDFGYELFIAAISILSVFNMFLSYLPGVDPAGVNVVYTINAVLTLLFVYDFSFRFVTAHSCPTYLVRNYAREVWIGRSLLN